MKKEIELLELLELKYDIFDGIDIKKDELRKKQIQESHEKQERFMNDRYKKQQQGE